MKKKRKQLIKKSVFKFSISPIISKIISSNQSTRHFQIRISNREYLKNLCYFPAVIDYLIRYQFDIHEYYFLRNFNSVIKLYALTKFAKFFPDFRIHKFYFFRDFSELFHYHTSKITFYKSFNKFNLLKSLQPTIFDANPMFVPKTYIPKLKVYLNKFRFIDYHELNYTKKFQFKFELNYFKMLIVKYKYYKRTLNRSNLIRKWFLLTDLYYKNMHAFRINFIFEQLIQYQKFLNLQLIHTMFITSTFQIRNVSQLLVKYYKLYNKFLLDLISPHSYFFITNRFDSFSKTLYKHFMIINKYLTSPSISKWLYETKFFLHKSKFSLIPGLKMEISEEDWKHLDSTYPIRFKQGFPKLYRVTKYNTNIEADGAVFASGFNLDLISLKHQALVFQFPIFSK